jgi:hypothetical protein
MSAYKTNPNVPFSSSSVKIQSGDTTYVGDWSGSERQVGLRKMAELERRLGVLERFVGHVMPDKSDLPQVYGSIEGFIGYDFVQATEEEALKLRLFAPWQPIETAPKDREVLLLMPSGEQRVGKWSTDSLRGNWQTADGLDLFYDPPTHWMPLPEPPK